MCVCREELKEAAASRSEHSSSQEWEEAAAEYCKAMDSILVEHLSTLRAQKKRRPAPHANVH